MKTGGTPVYLLRVQRPEDEAEIEAVCGYLNEKSSEARRPPPRWTK